MNVNNFVLFSFITFCILCAKEVYAGRKLIVVLVDGVRWDYLNNVSKLKGFRQIVENGVKASYVVPVYPSISYPNWYSIVTGLYAENHGFVGNFMFDNVTNLFYRMNPDPDATEPIWWNEAEPIWITAEKNNMSTAMYWWGGCEVRIRGRHPMICERERYGPHTPEEREDFIERIDDIVEMFKPSKRFPKDRLSLVLMYYGPVDYAGHFYGPKSRGTEESFNDIDGILDKMQSKLKKAHLENEVNIMVVSDHGMTDASAAKLVDLERFSGEIKYQVSTGTDSMIVPSDGMLDKLYSGLKAANLKGVDVYKKEDIPKRYHVKAGKRMTPIYLIAQKGYLIKGLNDLNKNIGGSGHISVGQHGYDPTVVEDMRTIFVATGPDFKVGYKSEPLNITDLYNVMCDVLKLKPLPNNGSWEKVSPIMKNNNQHSVLSAHTINRSSSMINDHYILSLLGSIFSILFVMISHKNYV